MINQFKLALTPVIILSILSFFFLWDVKFFYFQLRFLILGISFYLLIRLRNYTKDDIKFISIVTSFLVLIFLQYYLNIKINKFDYAYKDFFSIILLSYILYLSLQLHKEITDQLDLIIILFYTIFFFSIFFSIINFKHDAPIFCGGLSDFFTIFSHPNFFPNSAQEVGHQNQFLTRISFKEYIFLENSHLGMIAPAVILYSVSRAISEKKKCPIYINNCIFYNMFNKKLYDLSCGHDRLWKHFLIIKFFKI